MTETLPAFRYHPDPIATGSVLRSDKECLRCARSRGFVYVGPVYAVEEIVEALCPWCIADGSAAERYDATFTDILDLPAAVPRASIDEVMKRTPGFGGWQQEHWMFHCGDATAFMGRAGHVELLEHPEALEMVRLEIAGIGWSDTQIEDYLACLHKDGEATAYLFRCLHCDAWLAYSDFA